MSQNLQIQDIEVNKVLEDINQYELQEIKGGQSSVNVTFDGNKFIDQLSEAGRKIGCGIRSAFQAIF